MIASASQGIVRAVAVCSVLGLSSCVVTSGPPPATSAPVATPPSTPPAAVAPAPPPAVAPTPAAAAEPVPPQPTFAPTPEPVEKPAEHPHGFARGQPKDLQAGHPESLWVWHDDAAQWHVRSTTHAQEHRFSGRVWVSQGSIASVHPTRTEYNDRVRLSGRSIEFDFHTRGGIDGFDFSVAGAPCVHFALLVDGKGDPGRVKIGGNSVHPKHHVFTACP